MFRVQQSVKKVLLTVLWDMKKLNTIDFLKKSVTANNAPSCHLRWYYSSYILNDFCIYIYIYI